MDLLKPIKDQIHKLWGRVDVMPVVRWATVTQVSPLRVQLDGDVDPLPFPPQSTVAGLVVGERVVCVEQNRRIIILSRVEQPVFDTGWVSVTTGFEPGFTPGGTPGTLQYRVIGDEVHWRGGVSGTLPTGAYTTVVRGLPNLVTHTANASLRGGAAFSGGHPGIFEVSSAGTLIFAHNTGTNRVWAQLTASYLRD